MTAALFATWLVTQTWRWDPAPDAVAYRVYWGATGAAWCSDHRIEYPATVCVAGECQGEIPMPDFTPAFVMVTAVDAAGNESDTDHGDVVTCGAASIVEVAGLSP